MMCMEAYTRIHTHVCSSLYVCICICSLVRNILSFWLKDKMLPQKFYNIRSIVWCCSSTVLKASVAANSSVICTLYFMYEYTVHYCEGQLIYSYLCDPSKVHWGQLQRRPLIKLMLTRLFVLRHKAFFHISAGRSICHLISLSATPPIGNSTGESHPRSFKWRSTQGFEGLKKR